jgi:hypothetical protein
MAAGPAYEVRAAELREQSNGPSLHHVQVRRGPGMKGDLGNMDHKIRTDIRIQ